MVLSNFWQKKMQIIQLRSWTWSNYMENLSESTKLRHIRKIWTWVQISLLAIWIQKWTRNYYTTHFLHLVSFWPHQKSSAIQRREIQKDLLLLITQVLRLRMQQLKPWMDNIYVTGMMEFKKLMTSHFSIFTIAFSYYTFSALVSILKLRVLFSCVPALISRKNSVFWAQFTPFITVSELKRRIFRSFNYKFSYLLPRDYPLITTSKRKYFIF